MKFVLVLIAVINGDVEVKEVPTEFETLAECHLARAIHIELKPPGWAMVGDCIGIVEAELPPMS